MRWLRPVLALLVVAVLGALAFRTTAKEAFTDPATVEHDGVPPSYVIQPPHGKYLVSTDAQPAEVWAVGDGADVETGGAAVAELIEKSHPDRVLYLGDVYEDGTQAEFTQNYAPTFGRFSQITAPTMGNHDAPNVGDGYEPYWRGVYDATPPSFFSLDIAGWQVLDLNSEIAHGPSSQQVLWLDEHTHVEGDCRIAFWHRPRFSAGTTHGDDPSFQPFWDELHGRARLIINAHDHNMQRLERRRGIVELIAGSGGSERYPIDTSYEGLRFGDDETQGALRLRLRPGLASYAFVSTDGQILDSGRVRCSGAK